MFSKLPSLFNNYFFEIRDSERTRRSSRETPFLAAVLDLGFPFILRLNKCILAFVDLFAHQIYVATSAGLVVTRFLNDYKYKLKDSTLMLSQVQLSSSTITPDEVCTFSHPAQRTQKEEFNEIM